MIAACPKCSARYRIAKERVRPEGVRLRCSRCEAVFRVRSPEPDHPPVPQPPPPQVGLTPAAQVDVGEAPPARQAPPVVAPVPLQTEHRNLAPRGFEEVEENSLDRERLVLIADPMTDQGKATAATLTAWGLRPILVHDGVEAILTIQRKMPRAVVIDAALPKMYGFQICELLKRNESLRHIQVVLVGAIHDRNRYRRNPTEIYGADSYLERPQLPDALWPMLRSFGLPLSGGPPRHDSMPLRTETAPLHREHPPVVSTPQVSSTDLSGPVASEPSSPPIPTAAPDVPAAVVGTGLDPAPPPAAPTPPPFSERGMASAAPIESAPVDASFDAEIAKAERLARIVVSDIILYNQEKFDAAVEAGDVVASMGSDLDEGRTLFAQRIDGRIRETRDFLTEELIRVAELRRSQ